MSDAGDVIVNAANGSMLAYNMQGVNTAAPEAVTDAPQMHRQPEVCDINQ